MIPDFEENGFLPEGVHRATEDEFRQRFAVFDRSDRRIRLFEKLGQLLSEARNAEVVRRVIVAGSFVTRKAEPNDFDCILVLDRAIVGQTLRPFEYNLVSRRMARHLFAGDVVPAIEGSKALEQYVDFFQTSRDGQRVGVVEIEI